MASNLLKLPIQSLNPTNLSKPLSRHATVFTSTFLGDGHNCHHHCCDLHVSSFNFLCVSLKPKTPSLSVHSSLSSSSPPTSKEEAILQGKTCLSTTLEKPLNNPRLAGKLKKLKQPRFQIEIPLIDESPTSLSQLVLDVFQDLPIKRKGSQVKILLIWPNSSLKTSAVQTFQVHPSTHIDHIDISSVSNNQDSRILGSADVAVFVAPESSQLVVIKPVSDSFYPKPVVMFNPKWGFEESDGFGDLSGFVGSFEVIYSFMGLEVRGILSKRKGMVFKCVRDGVVSGEKWSVIVEEEGGEMKVVSKFKDRPSIAEVENVLYNLMAINSPITKSAKFLRDLVSNVTGRK